MLYLLPWEVFRGSSQSAGKFLDSAQLGHWQFLPQPFWYIPPCHPTICYMAWDVINMLKINDIFYLMYVRTFRWNLLFPSSTLSTDAVYSFAVLAPMLAAAVYYSVTTSSTKSCCQYAFFRSKGCWKSQCLSSNNFIFAWNSYTLYETHTSYVLHEVWRPRSNSRVHSHGVNSEDHWNFSL